MPSRAADKAADKPDNSKKESAEAAEGAGGAGGGRRRRRRGGGGGGGGGEKKKDVKASEEQSWDMNAEYSQWWSSSGWAASTDGADTKSKLPSSVKKLFAAAPSMQVQVPSTQLTPEGILGEWADSSGNKVTVFNTDAYELRLTATLSRPPRADIFLQVWPMPGGFWQCGNAILDPYWSTDKELHWVGSNGRVSVWVRTQEVTLPQEQDLQVADLTIEEASEQTETAQAVEKDDNKKNESKESKAPDAKAGCQA